MTCQACRAVWLTSDRTRCRRHRDNPPGPCSESGCTAPRYAKDRCKTHYYRHYMRQYRGGHTPRPYTKRTAAAARPKGRL